MSPYPKLSLQKGAYTTARGSVLWNKIPSEIKKLPRLNVFKTSFHGKYFSNTPWPIVTLIIHNVLHSPALQANEVTFFTPATYVSLSMEYKINLIGCKFSFIFSKIFFLFCVCKMRNLKKGLQAKTKVREKQKKNKSNSKRKTNSVWHCLILPMCTLVVNALIGCTLKLAVSFKMLKELQFFIKSSLFWQVSIKGNIGNIAVHSFYRTTVKLRQTPQDCINELIIWNLNPLVVSGM